MFAAVGLQKKLQPQNGDWEIIQLRNLHFINDDPQNLISRGHYNTQYTLKPVQPVSETIIQSSQHIPCKNMYMCTYIYIL